MTEANAATTTALPPCLFRFDDGPTWEGFAHGSTWNGFDNVAVTRETLDRIAEWAAETAVGNAEEARAQFARRSVAAARPRKTRQRPSPRQIAC